MEELNIICIDDQREVLNILRNDLDALQGVFHLIQCESAMEAGEVLDEIDRAGAHAVLLICDQVMPGKTGVLFLSDVQADGRFPHTKKILLTGLATHQDTIQAINRAAIDAYIEKPWDPENLLGEVKRLVTKYMVQAGLEYEGCLHVLDQQVLYEELRKHG
ncbi:MAG: response regulator [Deltaproteobacteria bacterium]|nr:response regulator [Deltaproteobacteria bacterium]